MSTTAALRKAASAARLNVDKARAALDDLDEVKGCVDALVDADVSDALDTVDEFVAALAELVGHGLGVSDEDMATIAAAAETLRNLVPDPETLVAIQEAFPDAEQAVEVCEEHRDAERGEYDTDTKQEAREEAQEALTALADAIEAAEPPTPVAATP